MTFGPGQDSNSIMCNNMELERKAAEDILRTKVPFIISATMTDDMGAEFSAAVPEGIIFAVPGMLLDFSDKNGSYLGNWPPFIWSIKGEDEYLRCMRDFLINDFWRVTPWEEVDDGLVFNLVNFLNEPEYFNLNSYESN